MKEAAALWTVPVELAVEVLQIAVVAEEYHT
jgi:hypothetical protein